MVEDFYSQLTGLPARVTADETARWLEAYGGNIKTQRTSSLKNPDYALDLFLTSFHGDLSQSPSMAIMEMKMTLTKVAGPVVVIAKTYRAQRPFNFTSPELRPELLAQNLSLALGDILSQFLEDFKAN
jgi:hypothetical protein